MKEKISIIIPVYDVEQYLSRCIESIINQTYKNLEIILIDDGSTDKSPVICDTYAESDYRIKVIHKSNGGLSDARNAGLDIATGEFIIFVDSDDYIELNLCKKCMESISDEIDIVAYGFERFCDGNDAKRKATVGNIRRIPNNELFKYYIDRHHLTHMVCDKMFRKYLFKSIRFIKGRLAEDMAICYQLIGMSKEVIVIDEVLYNYYTRSDSIMGTGSLKLCIDAYKGECEAYDYGNLHFPQFKKNNDTRFLNQSMKVYLKLTKLYKLSVQDVNVQIVTNNIKQLKKRGLPLSTLGFYTAFYINKKIAWMLFKVLKLT